MQRPTMRAGLVPSGIEFAYLMALPEMAELLATAPRLWRVLRPLCRMFGITPPEDLPPPPAAPRRRAPAAAPDPQRKRRRSEAAAVRDHGLLGYRPPIFGRSASAGVRTPISLRYHNTLAHPASEAAQHGAGISEPEDLSSGR